MHTNQTSCYCCADFAFFKRVGRRGISLHSFVEVPPEPCSAIIPSSIGVFLCQQQFFPLGICMSNRASHRISPSSTSSHDPSTSRAALSVSNADTYKNKMDVTSVMCLTYQNACSTPATMMFQSFEKIQYVSVGVSGEYIQLNNLTHFSRSTLYIRQFGPRLEQSWFGALLYCSNNSKDEKGSVQV